MRRVGPLPPAPCPLPAAQTVAPAPALCPAVPVPAWALAPLSMPGPFACLAWSHSEARLLYVAEKSRPKPRPPSPWDVPGAARLVEEDEDEGVSAMCSVNVPHTLCVCCVPHKDAVHPRSMPYTPRAYHAQSPVPWG